MVTLPVTVPLGVWIVKAVGDAEPMEEYIQVTEDDTDQQGVGVGKARQFPARHTTPRHQNPSRSVPIWCPGSRSPCDGRQLGN